MHEQRGEIINSDSLMYRFVKTETLIEQFMQTMKETVKAMEARINGIEELHRREVRELKEDMNKKLDKLVDQQTDILDEVRKTNGRVTTIENLNLGRELKDLREKQENDRLKLTHHLGWTAGISAGIFGAFELLKHLDVVIKLITGK